MLCPTILAEERGRNPLAGSGRPHDPSLALVVPCVEVAMARGHTVVNSGDRIVLFAARDVVKKVEKMFAVRLEFF